MPRDTELESAQAQVAVLREALYRMVRHVESPVDPACHCLLMAQAALSDTDPSAADAYKQQIEEAAVAAVKRQVVPLVAVGISSLPNGGGVSYREAEAIGAKIAALLDSSTPGRRGNEPR
jgi:hypothetical protein